MATKKKKSSSTALAKRDDDAPKGRASLAVIRKENAEIKGQLTALTTTINDMQRAMLQLAERVKTGPTDAPPPLFEYNLDVDLIRDHDVLLVSSEVKNNGLRELRIATCTLVVDGRPVREMEPRYRDDIELEGCVWATGRDDLQSGLEESYAWAFENAGDIDSVASVMLRIGGVELIENVKVRKFDPERPPSTRKTPKLLTSGSKSEHTTEPPKEAPTNESLWRA